jgi:hypothetical protein
MGHRGVSSSFAASRLRLYCAGSYGFGALGYGIAVLLASTVSPLLQSVKTPSASRHQHPRERSRVRRRRVRYTSGGETSASARESRVETSGRVTSGGWGLWPGIAASEILDVRIAGTRMPCRMVDARWPLRVALGPVAQWPMQVLAQRSHLTAVSREPTVRPDASARRSGRGAAQHAVMVTTGRRRSARTVRRRQTASATARPPRDAGHGCEWREASPLRSAARSRRRESAVSAVRRARVWGVSCPCRLRCPSRLALGLALGAPRVGCDCRVCVGGVSKRCETESEWPSAPRVPWGGGPAAAPLPAQLHTTHTLDTAHGAGRGDTGCRLKPERPGD